jgi:hypothetical protein
MLKKDEIDPRILTGGIKFPAEIVFRLNLCKWLLITSIFAAAFFFGWSALIVTAASYFCLLWTIGSMRKFQWPKS